jgi:hypothetical protein
MPVMSSLQSIAGQGMHQRVLSFLHLVAGCYFFLGFGRNLIYTRRKFLFFYTISMQDSFNNAQTGGALKIFALEIFYFRLGRRK